MSAMVQAALIYLSRAEPFNVSPAPGAVPTTRPPTPEQVAAGIVSVGGQWHSLAELELVLKILDGYHINANNTSGAEAPLIATTLSIDDSDATIEYPPGESRTFEFSDKPLRVYENQVTLRVRFSSHPKPESTLRLKLTYQPCDKASCLPAITKQIDIEVPSIP
jgi:hypothetical protein